MLSTAAALLSYELAASAVTCTKPHAPDGNGRFNSSLVFQAFPEPALVPWPSQISGENKYVPLPASTSIVASSSLFPLSSLLQTQIKAITGLGLTVQNTSTARFSTAPSINLHLAPNDFQGESSALSVNQSGVYLSAGEYGALVSATVTLLQAIEYSHDVDSVPISSANCTTEFGWRVPHLEILDKPTFGFRGIMVDAARADLGTKTDIFALKQYVILASFYKCNHLHIHFSDDDAFTFPSQAFPELPGHSSHAYTLSEMRELSAFAALRGVAIIGEIDVPGHSKGIVAASPGLFAFPSSPHLGVVDFTNPAVVKRLQTIFDEILAIFPSDHIHIGADEVNFNILSQVPEVKAAIKTQNLSSVVDLYRGFIATMDAFAVARGKTLHAWEGFAPQNGQGGRSTQPASSVAINPSSGITIEPFDCYYYPPPQLAQDGYKIINSCWSPLYIADGQGRDPELIYQWHPWLFGEVSDHLSWWEIPKQYRHKVVGVQMAVWETGTEDTLSALALRVPAMVDRSHNPYAMRTFADFQARYNSADAKLSRLLAALPSSPTPLPSPLPPFPPSPSPLPGGKLSPVKGECRDAKGKYGPRIESRSKRFSECMDLCERLGMRCDALDIDGQPPALGADPVLEWCAVWGMSLVPSDIVNKTSGFKYTCDAGCADRTGSRVCRGDSEGPKNTCYHRPPFC